MAQAVAPLSDREAPAEGPAKRRQILEGARRVFFESGYEGASMSAIAREAAVSKGTLYVYFASKEALFAAVVAQTCDEQVPYIFDALKSEAPVEAVLREVGTRFITYLLSPHCQAFYRLVIAESAKFPELGRAFYDAGPSVGPGLVATFLRRRVAAGELEIVDCDLAASQFLELCKADLMLKRQVQVIDRSSPARIDYVVENAVRLFLRGYRF